MSHPSPGKITRSYGPVAVGAGLLMLLGILAASWISGIGAVVGTTFLYLWYRQHVVAKAEACSGPCPGCTACRERIDTRTPGPR